ncbi:MAG TPA: hypothetical protein VMI92_10930 [Steroidobacteraceae bacterium]|nr:hypothetical protein [Steroidobacteraceae bacterium]
MSTSNTISLQLDHSGAIFPEPEPGRPVLIAFADDPQVLDALGEAIGGDLELIVAPSQERFADQILANPARLVLLDCAATGLVLNSLITNLHARFPDLTVVVSGTGRDQAQVASQLETGEVFRFVNKPVSAQRLRMVVDAALRQVATPAPTTLDAPSPPPARPGLRLLLVALAVLALLSGGYFWWSQLRGAGS